ncbi:hypothetical protein LTR36_007727 [Oleoguttula mirabilis]|uniref:RNA-dependent RNA polymerase n=1 Tax=Oleoguttula mirabilis TaxID=1507867 RepID=A0AAV9JU83_9PEZI|nr:hypothetical protein LTR36_007727 [Oleoguttula mirabilis]
MDIFVQDVPLHATSKQLEDAFRAPLSTCGAHVFHAYKMVNKTLAIVTVLDTLACEQFLRAARLTPVIMKGKPLRCSKSSKSPTTFSVRALLLEAAQEAVKKASGAGAPRAPQSAFNTNFSSTRIQCGIWEYDGTQLAFQQHYSLAVMGTVVFGTREAIILLNPPGCDQIRAHINYYICDSIILGDFADPSVAFTVQLAPKFYSVPVVSADDLSSDFRAMGLNARAQKTRLLEIDAAHGRVAGFCPVYRVTLADVGTISAVRTLLRKYRSMPPVLPLYTPVLVPPPGSTIECSFARLTHDLADTQRYGDQPFSVRYQLIRLATNAFLSPVKVRRLLPKVRAILSRHGLDAALSALRRFSRMIPLAGPETEAVHYTETALDLLLEECALCYDRHTPENPYEIAKRHEHVNLIHRVVITPTSMYLEGPDPEPTNRVLRDWADHTDHFIRVVFQDENGSSVRFDAHTSQHMVFHKRFKGVLDTQILIAGRGFSFLGFSHSSLRSQSCWSMAPLVVDGGLAYADHILKKLGDFSNFRVPAKCAARIGQNFTDTNATLDLKPTELFELEMVQRNGRDFSDGVGTISLDLLKEVWKVYGKRRSLKPTALQIRFQGAKGMVSLDTRLSGRKLLLRENMIKYKTKNLWNLEICGAAFRPLPMFLNRQLIQLLENLGVSEHDFMELQQLAMDKLRCMTTSAINTATLLEDTESPKTTRLPELIKALGEIGLDYHQDHFLYGVVEMAVVIKLGEIKYRGRIRVAQGVTLLGILDETGYLREGQVYVVTESGPEGGREVWRKNRILITRSPAMHPGDIQLVNAVDVPPGSPLEKLSNVVVFSQHGARDLPSQLSGGDLDGDIYNLIYDPNLIPPTTYAPAAYPRVSPVELDHTVTRRDMSNFLVTFMESDVLAPLCRRHMQIADQLPTGTFSPECIKVAGMASVAVDFSKSGRSVIMQQCPKADRSGCMPDFMAWSPRVFVNEHGYTGFQEAELEEDESVNELSNARPPNRYYKSDKVLGKLFRAIDERVFLAEIQTQHRAVTDSALSTANVMTDLLTYMESVASDNLLIYSHHEELARDIRASYEDALLNIAYQCAPSAQHPVSEQEVFAGTILGRQTGPVGKPLRELSKTMRERFGNVVDYTVAQMLTGERVVAEEADVNGVYNESLFESLPRAVACLSVAVKEEGLNDRKLGSLKSFKYIAAGVCLRELQRFRITTFASYTLPRVQRDGTSAS